MPAPSAAPSPRVRILCADDEPAIRDVLRALLQREGFDVQAVNDGQEAWQILSAAPAGFDLLITDNEMPALSGLRLVEKVRTAGSTLRIIVFSASLLPADEDAFRGWEIDAIVRKGSPIDELLDEVHRLAKLAKPHFTVLTRGERP